MSDIIDSEAVKCIFGKLFYGFFKNRMLFDDQGDGSALTAFTWVDIYDKETEE